MASKQDRLVRHIRALAGGGAGGAATDRELLGRFARDRDEDAFAALVRRHGPMVLSACERVLGSRPDAEDCSQAVFLLLAREAASPRWRDSVAGWLHRAAVHTALKAVAARATRRKAEAGARVAPARDPLAELSVRDLQAALDEELARLPDRYRAPVLLCCLEGLARDEAAQRLGWDVGLVKSRLEDGRERLRRRLERRGVLLSAALAALTLTGGAGSAAVGRLATGIPGAAVRILAGEPPTGAVPAAVSELLQGGTRTMSATAFKITTALCAAVGLIAAGVSATSHGGPATAFAAQAAADPQGKPPPAPKPDKMEKAKADGKAEAKPGETKPRTIGGTVVGPEGKPMAGVAINTRKPGKTENDKPAVQELAKTDADGRFSVTLDPLPPGEPDVRQVVAAKAGFGPDWVTVRDIGDGPVSLKLAADDVPVKGRVTDLEGKVVPKAVVKIWSVAATPTGDWSKVWEEWPRSPYNALGAPGKSLYQPTLGGLPESVTADADGKFEIKGVGRGRLLGLVFEGAGIETAACRVVLDPKFDPKAVEQPTPATMPGNTYQPGPALYGPTFTHAGNPSQPVVGRVTDGTTGRPLAGVNVVGDVAGPHWFENFARTTTDAAGKFTLHGVAKADKVRLFVSAAEDQPYLPYYTTVAGQPGLTEIAADLKLTRGVRVKGRVVEKGSGKPVAGAALQYTALADNKHYAKWMGDRQAAAGGVANITGADGRFEFTALPGAGVVLAQGETRGRTAGTEYTQVRVAKPDLPRADLAYLDSMGETFTAAAGHIITLHSISGYAIIDPKPTDDTAEVTIEFDRGKTATGTVVGPDGKPAAGVTAYNLTACYDVPRKLKDGAFTAIALEADHPRTLLFVDEAKKLAGSIDLKGDEKDATVKLQPWGKISGRLLDADGKPLAGAGVRVYVKNSIRHAAFGELLRDRKTTTDQDGKFTLDVPAGPAEYVLGFSRKNQYLDTGYRPDSKGHTVKPGETTAVGDVAVKRD
jgi:RNA polymerase sigma factor (sigma-70 family)